MQGASSVAQAGGVRVGKGKGYNHVCVANVLPCQHRTAQFRLVIVIITKPSICRQPLNKDAYNK